jgi:invasion protein IalB
MRRFLSVFVLTLPIWLAQPVMAQSDTVTSGSSTDSSSETRNTHQDWQSLCELREENTICQISQTLKIEKDGQVDFTVRITLTKRAGKILMEVALPLGLDLPAGIALQVDESNEINLPFATCVALGCAVVVETKEEFLNQLRKGTILKVAFRPFGQTQGVLLNVSLRGFTSAIQVLSD